MPKAMKDIVEVFTEGPLEVHSALSLEIMNKDAIVATAQIAAESIKTSGEYDPLRELALVTKMRTFCEELAKGIRGAAADAADEFRDEQKLNGHIDRHGVQFALTTTPARLTYDHAEKWKALKNLETATANERKTLEKMMKAAREPFADVETGEIIEPAKQVGGGAASLRVKI